MTRLVLLPVDHPNLYTNYLKQEQFCEIALETLYREGDAILVEDDASKEQLNPFGIVPANARLVGWYDPEVAKVERTLLQILPALERLEFNIFRPRVQDVNALINFTADKPSPELLEEKMVSLPGLVQRARYHFNRLFNETFKSGWAARQAFLEKQVNLLKKEGVNTIYLKGGRDHFDDTLLHALQLPYTFLDQQPQPSAEVEAPKTYIQQLP